MAPAQVLQGSDSSLSELLRQALQYMPARKQLYRKLSIQIPVMWLCVGALSDIEAIVCCGSYDPRRTLLRSSTATMHPLL